MGNHKLEKGKTLISDLVELGKILGYFSKPEFPIDKSRKNSPAVDVAWVSDENHEFPLMIFEVESKIIGSIANNPTKVFGLPNESFEKPLFFFHIFLKTPENSSKVDNLKNLFGLYNYRTYDFSKDDEHTRFLCDILSQHRRLYRKIDLEGVLFSLKNSSWEFLDLSKVLIHIEKLYFDAKYLKTYATFCLNDINFKKHYLRFLKSYLEVYPKKYNFQDYETYWGYEWVDPIHYAILVNSDKYHQNDYLDKLISWQDNSTYLSMIGPHFGISREYDEFIICLASPFLAFLSTLMRNCKDGMFYICKQLNAILEGLSAFDKEISFFTAIWLLHVAAACKSVKYFNFAKNFVNDRGGISERFLYLPPNSIPFISDEDVLEYKRWNEELQRDKIEVPKLTKFNDQKVIKIKQYTIENENVLDFALNVLLDPGIHSDWSHRIVFHLAK